MPHGLVDILLCRLSHHSMSNLLQCFLIFITMHVKLKYILLCTQIWSSKWMEYKTWKFKEIAPFFDLIIVCFWDDIDLHPHYALPKNKICQHCDGSYTLVIQIWGNSIYYCLSATSIRWLQYLFGVLPPSLVIIWYMIIKT